MTYKHKTSPSLKQVAVWIDHRKAVLAIFKNAHLLREEKLFSEAGPHTHGGGWSQKRFESHRHTLLDHYYEEIVHELSGADQIILYGPGQAKHELERHINQTKSLQGHILNVEAADQMGESQLARQALADFGAAYANKNAYIS